MCLQLLPQKRSLQIYGNTKTDKKKILLVPEEAGLQNVVVSIVGSDECYHKPFSDSFTESFCAKRDFMDSLTLVFDKDIKNQSMVRNTNSCGSSVKWRRPVYPSH
nr:unnamed protein product [Spirometra erinaceieuropaei]